MITATRFHDFSCGHRVAGHESKCAHLHGHNYRVHFTVVSDGTLDHLGRVMDFSCINDRLCQWLEHNWDHKFLYWNVDPVIVFIRHQIAPHAGDGDGWMKSSDSFVPLRFNPTAENMAFYLLREIGPAQLAGSGCRLIKVVVEETRKCSATAEL